jgi:hypothetical protein
MPLTEKLLIRKARLAERRHQLEQHEQLHEPPRRVSFSERFPAIPRIYPSESPSPPPPPPPLYDSDDNDFGFARAPQPGLPNEADARASASADRFAAERARQHELFSQRQIIEMQLAASQEQRQRQEQEQEQQRGKEDDEEEYEWNEKEVQQHQQQRQQQPKHSLTPRTVSGYGVATTAITSAPLPRARRTASTLMQPVASAQHGHPHLPPHNQHQQHRDFAPSASSHAPQTIDSQLPQTQHHPPPARQHPGFPSPPSLIPPPPTMPPPSHIPPTPTMPPPSPPSHATDRRHAPPSSLSSRTTSSAAKPYPNGYQSSSEPYSSDRNASPPPPPPQQRPRGHSQHVAAPPRTHQHAASPPSTTSTPPPPPLSTGRPPQSQAAALRSPRSPSSLHRTASPPASVNRNPIVLRHEFEPDRSSSPHHDNSLPQSPLPPHPPLRHATPPTSIGPTSYAYTLALEALLSRSPELLSSAMRSLAQELSFIDRQLHHTHYELNIEGVEQLNHRRSFLLQMLHTANLALQASSSSGPTISRAASPLPPPPRSRSSSFSSHTSYSSHRSFDSSLSRADLSHSAMSHSSPFRRNQPQQTVVLRPTSPTPPLPGRRQPSHIVLSPTPFVNSQSHTRYSRNPSPMGGEEWPGRAPQRMPLQSDVGIVFQQAKGNGQWVVMAVDESTASGVCVGDICVSIDGVPIAAVFADDIDGMLQGKHGASANLHSHVSRDCSLLRPPHSFCSRLRQALALLWVCCEMGKNFTQCQHQTLHPPTSTQSLFPSELLMAPHGLNPTAVTPAVPPLASAC